MDLFIDRSRWPELIRTGYERTSAALGRLRRQQGSSQRGYGGLAESGPGAVASV
jgi:hypothetical protein